MEDDGGVLICARLEAALSSTQAIAAGNVLGDNSVALELWCAGNQLEIR